MMQEQVLTREQLLFSLAMEMMTLAINLGELMLLCDRLKSEKTLALMKRGYGFVLGATGCVLLTTDDCIAFQSKCEHLESTIAKVESAFAGQALAVPIEVPRGSTPRRKTPRYRQRRHQGRHFQELHVRLFQTMRKLSRLG